MIPVIYKESLVLCTGEQLDKTYCSGKSQAALTKDFHNL